MKKEMKIVLIVIAFFFIVGIIGTMTNFFYQKPEKPTENNSLNFFSKCECISTNEAFISDDVVSSRVVPDIDDWRSLWAGFDIVIRLNNPFPAPISPRITQLLPEGLKIKNVSGGTAEGNCACWLYAISPHTTEELILHVERNIPPEQNILIEGARVEIYDPSKGEIVIFAARDINLSPVMPIRAKLFPPFPVELVFGSENNLLCQAENLLPTDVAAEFIIKIASMTGDKTYFKNYSLSLKGEENKNFTLPLPQDIALGDYVIYVDLKWKTLKESLYSGVFTVLAEKK